MMVKLIAAVFITALAIPASAAVNVFACEPEWASLAKEIGGDRVSVYSATTALQDPHRIQARPSLIARMRKADLVICTGADLEVGWLPLLLRKANNPRVLPGKPGYFEAASQVLLLDKPSRLDRADGDVHAAGNPHIQNSPHNIVVIANELEKRLVSVDADSSDDYMQRLTDFSKRWNLAIKRWEKSAAPLRGMKIVVQHRSWVYLQAWLGLEVVASIEPKPGVPPASGSLARLVNKLEKQDVKAIIRAAYQDGGGADWLAQRTGIPLVVLPFTVGGSDRAQDLFSLYDETLDRLLSVVPQP